MATRLARTSNQIRVYLEQFIADLVRSVADRDRSAPRSFRGSMPILRTTKAKGTRIRIPHFWGEWYHEGRGKTYAKPGGVLVFWTKDATTDDPRITGGYPRTRSQVKHLSKKQFEAALADPGVIVTKVVNKWAGNPFLGRAGKRVATESFYRAVTDKKAADLMDGYLDRKLKFRTGSKVRTFPPARATVRVAR